MKEKKYESYSVSYVMLLFMSHCRLVVIFLLNLYLVGMSHIHNFEAFFTSIVSADDFNFHVGSYKQRSVHPYPNTLFI